MTAECGKEDVGIRAAEHYMCRKCGIEFTAIPGEEKPPECPECESDETEKLERATYGGTTEEQRPPEKK